MAYTLLDDETPAKGYQLLDDEKKGTGSDAVDTANAVGTGYWKGMMRLLGTPADTAANVLDLGKAALGAPYIALTGKAPPSFLEVGDRSKVVGSGDYLIKNAQKTKAGEVMLSPANPAYENGYAEALGGGLTGVINPQTKLQAINQAVLSSGGNIAGKAVYDATGSVPLSIAASMSPSAAQDAAIRGTKLAIRGGEQGRKLVEQRIQDLKNASVDNPSLGLATGSTLLGGLENILQSTPGAATLMQRNRANAVTGLENTIGNAADLASTNRGSTAAGKSMQTGGEAFRADFKQRQQDLYNRLDQYIPPMSQVDVSKTRGTLAALNADIPTMPELSKQFKNGRIQAIEAALNSDLAGTPAVPPQTTHTTQRIVVGTDGAGMPVYKDVLVPTTIPGIPAGPDRNAPWTAVKQTRTLVGNEIADNNIASSVPRSKWNPLYGALSSDMEVAANAAGPDATKAFNRASNYTRAGSNRMDATDSILRRDTPEETFKAMEGALRDNPTDFQAVKKSLPEGARGDFAGTVIEKLGKATAGQQDNTGGKFSTETFLTNWNRMNEKSKAEMLSGFPNAKQVREDVEAVAKAASMMRDSSKILYNPSGTAAKSAAIGYLGLLGGSVGSGNLSAAGGLLAMPVAANLAARAVTSPRVVNSMASRTAVDPEIIRAQVNGLLSSGLLEYPQ